MADRQEEEDRRPQSCDRAWHDDLSGACPGPHICDFWTREGSAANYDDGSSFQIGRIDMVANTGTYLDCAVPPLRRGQGPLPSFPWVHLPICRASSSASRGTETSRSIVPAFEGRNVRGKAVLVHTGWDRHWRTDRYGEEHPFLTPAAADWLVEQGAALVGIDSNNIDDTRHRTRPVHTRLLGADIPICEHMTALDQLPDEGFRFSGVPPKVLGMGTFPVRAYAVLD